MPIPSTIKLPGIEGYDLILVQTREMLQERLNLLATHPNANKWMLLSYTHTGQYTGQTLSNNKKVPASSQYKQQVVNTGYPPKPKEIRLLNNELLLDYTLSVSEPELYKLVSLGHFDDPPIYTDNKPVKLTIQAEIELVTKGKRTEPFIDRKKSKEKKPGNEQKHFKNWQARESYPFAFGIQLNDPQCSIPIVSLHHSLREYRRNDEKRDALLLMGVTQGNKLPDTIPSVQYANWIEKVQSSCALVCSSRMLMQWILQRFAEEARVDAANYYQETPNGPIKIKVPHPLEFRRGGRTYKDIAGNTNEIEFTFEVLKDAPLHYCKLSYSYLMTFPKGKWYKSRYDIGFYKFLSFWGLVSEVKPYRSDPEYSTDPTFQNILLGLGDPPCQPKDFRGNSTPRITFKLPEADRFLYSKPFIMDGDLVLTAIPKY